MQMACLSENEQSPDGGGGQRGRGGGDFERLFLQISYMTDCKYVNLGDGAE